MTAALSSKSTARLMARDNLQNSAIFIGHPHGFKESPQLSVGSRLKDAFHGFLTPEADLPVSEFMGGLTPPKRSLDFAGAREALHLVARRDLKDDFVIFPVEVGDVHGLGAEGAAEDRAVPGSQHGKRNDHAARGTRDHPADADVNLGLEWRLCLVPRARLPHFREGTIRQPALDLVSRSLRRPRSSWSCASCRRRRASWPVKPTRRSPSSRP